MQYLDLNIDTAGKISDKKQILQSIKTILFTPIGSRVMRRDFGSLLPELIDAASNEATKLKIVAAITIALNQYEPRINLIAVNFVTNQEKLTLQLTFALKNQPQHQELALITI